MAQRCEYVQGSITTLAQVMAVDEKEKENLCFSLDKF